MQTGVDKKYSSYQNSPLADLLGELLPIIQTIKKTYPDDKKNPETHRAFLLLRIVEEVVGILNTNLPVFSKGAVPGSLSLAYIAAKLGPYYVSSLASLFNSFLSSKEVFYCNLMRYFEWVACSNPGVLAFSSTHIEERLNAGRKSWVFRGVEDLSDEDKSRLLTESFQQIGKINQLMGVSDSEDINIGLIIAHIGMNFVLERLLQHPIYPTLLEKIAPVLVKVPSEFKNLVPFLADDFLPRLLLKTTIFNIIQEVDKTINGENSNIIPIKDVRTLGEFKYELEHDTKKPSFELVDISGEYRYFKVFLPIALSICRRHFLAHPAHLSDELKQIFRQQELDEIHKHCLWTAKVADEIQTMEDEYEQISQCLKKSEQSPDNFSIEDFKTRLTTCAELEAYIQQLQEKNHKTFPVIVPISEAVTKLDLFPARQRLSQAVQRITSDAEKLKAAFSQTLSCDFLELYSEKIKCYPFCNKDALEMLQTKISRNDKGLTQLRALLQRLNEDEKTIKEYLANALSSSPSHTECLGWFTNINERLNRKIEEITTVIRELKEKQVEHQLAEQKSVLEDQAAKQTAVKISFEQFNHRSEALMVKHGRLMDQCKTRELDHSQVEIENFDNLQVEIEHFKEENALLRRDLAQYSCSGTESLEPLLLTLDLSLELSVKSLKVSREMKQAMEQRRQLVATHSNNLESSLVNLLNHYIETGDLDTVIQWMQRNQPTDYHLHRKTKWHQVHSLFWDIKYSPKVVFSTIEIETKITTLPANNPNEENSLRSLYTTLQDIRRKFEATTTQDLGNQAIVRLVDDLTQDLGRFVHEQISFDDFQYKFLARLHSQDELMHTKNTNEAWRYCMANLLIGLFSVGIALAIQWTYMRLSQGRGTLFFDETAKEQYVKRIDVSLSGLSSHQGRSG